MNSKLYQIFYSDKFVQVDLPSFSSIQKKKFKQMIESRLSTHPVEFGKPLQYSFKGHRRLRIGDYRVIFKIEESTHSVFVLAIAHRKDIYE